MFVPMSCASMSPHFLHAFLQQQHILTLFCRKAGCNSGNCSPHSLISVSCCCHASNFVTQQFQRAVKCCGCVAGNHRKLRVSKQPNVTLTLDHVPQHCRRARTILMGPLTPTDLDAAAFVHQQLGMLRPTNSCMLAVNWCTECAGTCRGSIPRPSPLMYKLLQTLILFCMLSRTF